MADIRIETAIAGIEKAISDLKKPLAPLKELKAATSELSSSAEKAARSLGSMDAATRNATTGFKGTFLAVTDLRLAISGLIAGLGLKQLAELGDAGLRIESRLKLATKSALDLEQAQLRLAASAKSSFQSFETTADTFFRLTQATNALGLSQDRVIDITDTLNKAIAITGGNSISASAGLFQLSQGLAAGAVRGEEYNSVAEQTPTIMIGIANALEIPIDKMREFAFAGGLTTERVIAAMEAMKSSIETQFDDVNVTISNAFQNIRTESILLIDKINETTKVISTFVKGLEFVAENLELLAKLAGSLAVIITSKLLVSFLSAKGAIFATSGVLSGFLALVGGIPGLIALAVGALASAIIFFDAFGNATSRAAAAQRDFANAVGNTDKLSAGIRLGHQLQDLAEQQRKQFTGARDAYNKFLQTVNRQVKFSSLEDLEQALIKGDSAVSQYRLVFNGLRSDLANAQGDLDKTNSLILNNEKAVNKLNVATGKVIETNTVNEKMLEEIRKALALLNKEDKESLKLAKEKQRAIDGLVNDFFVKYDEEVKRITESTQLFNKVFAEAFSDLDLQLKDRLKDGEEALADLSDQIADAFGSAFDSILDDGEFTFESLADSISGVFKDLTKGILRDSFKPLFDHLSKVALGPEGLGGGFFGTSLDVLARSGIAGFSIGGAAGGGGLASQLLGGAGGILGNLGGTALGNQVGGLLGSILPGVGNIVGGLAGGFLGSLFGPDPTSGLQAGAIDLDDFDIRTSGLTGDKFSQQNRDAADSILASIQGLAGILNQVGGRGRGAFEIAAGDREGLQFRREDLGQAFQSFGTDRAGFITALTQSVVGSFEGLSSDIQLVLDDISLDNLQEAAENINFAATFRTMFDPQEAVGPFETAVNVLTEAFEAAKAKAQELGLDVDALTQSFQRGAERIRQDFNQQISDAILQLTDPFAFALLELDREFEVLRAEAVATGGNLAEVERLFGLRRSEILEQFLGDDLDSLGDSAKTAGETFKDLSKELDKAVNEVIKTNEKLQDSINKTRDRVRETLIRIGAATPLSVEQLQAQLGSGSLEQQVQVVEALRAAIEDRFNVELNGIEETQRAQEAKFREELAAFERMQDLARGLKVLSEDLLLSQISPLTNRQRFEEAQNQFGQLAFQARGGDLDALARLGGAAQTFQQENQAFNASSPEAVRIFNEIQAVLESVSEGLLLRAPPVMSEDQFRATLTDAQERAASSLEELDVLLVDLQAQADRRAQEDTDRLINSFHADIANLTNTLRNQIAQMPAETAAPLVAALNAINSGQAEIANSAMREFQNSVEQVELARQLLASIRGLGGTTQVA